MKGKNKDEILEEIKVLKENNPSEFKELKKEIRLAIADMSTDDEGHHSPKNKFLQNIKENELPVIDKEALKGDKWGHCKLSYAIEDGDIKLIEQMYQLQEKLSDADLLKRIAIDLMNKSIQSHYEIDEKVVSEIYSGIEYQLRLIGEDISDVMDVHLI